MEQVSEDETSDWTPIRIETPLPMGVAGALMQLIGTAWPEAVIRTDRGQNKLIMLVPPKGARSVSKVEAQDLAKDAEAGEFEGEFLGFDDGWVRTAPPEELCLYLGEIGRRILESTPGAVNYVEWEIVAKDSGARHVLSVARSKGQTPGALHKEAKAEVERLTALLVEHGIDLTK